MALGEKKQNNTCLLFYLSACGLHGGHSCHVVSIPQIICKEIMICEETQECIIPTI